MWLIIDMPIQTIGLECLIDWRPTTEKQFIEQRLPRKEENGNDLSQLSLFWKLKNISPRNRCFQNNIFFAFVIKQYFIPVHVLHQTIPKTCCFQNIEIFHMFRDKMSELHRLQKYFWLKVHISREKFHYESQSEFVPNGCESSKCQYFITFVNKNQLCHTCHLYKIRLAPFIFIELKFIASFCINAVGLNVRNILIAYWLTGWPAWLWSNWLELDRSNINLSSILRLQCTQFTWSFDCAKCRFDMVGWKFEIVLMRCNWTHVFSHSFFIDVDYIW